MKSRFLVILTVAAAILAGCSGTAGKKAEKGGPEYFRNVLFSETPWDIEKGTYPLTAEEAKTVNSYKFTRDEQGKLLSVEFLRGDSLLGYGNLDGAAKIVYEYNGNKQVKKFYDKKNNQIEVGGVYTEEYTLDEKGVRTGLKYFGKDGQPVENRNKIHNWVWTILPDGMLREQRYNLAGVETIMNPFCPFFELRFTYNEKGFVTRMANYMADTLYNCTAENCGDIGVSYFTFTNSENGDVLKFEVFNVTGQMSNLYWGWSKRESKYDANGYPVEVAYFDQDNEYLGGKANPVTSYKYDEHGAVVEIQNLDKDRKLMNNESGVAITEFKYDATGNRIETIRYDKDRVQVKE
jgi:YD repeat-containing protein